MLELYVTGSDETSDKIFVTAGLTATMQSLGYSTGVYKPVDITAVDFRDKLKSSDFAFINYTDPYIETYYSYLFKENTSPLLAAAMENKIIDKNEIIADFKKVKGVNECLLVDGVNGLSSPLGKDFLEEDIVKSFDIPLLMVVSAKAQTVNNAIMTINHADEVGIKVRGVILSNYPENTEDMNIKFLPRFIEEYTKTKIMGILPAFKKDINPNDLITAILNGVDIEGVFGIKIAKLQM